MSAGYFPQLIAWRGGRPVVLAAFESRCTCGGGAGDMNGDTKSGGDYGLLSAPHGNLSLGDFAALVVPRPPPGVEEAPAGWCHHRRGLTLATYVTTSAPTRNNHS